MNSRHIGQRMIVAAGLTATMAGAVLLPGTVWAQTNGTNQQNNNARPIQAQTRQNVPPFFMPSAHINMPSAHINQPSAHMNISPLSGQSNGFVGNGYYVPNTTVVYPPYYGYGGYGYGGYGYYPDTTVIINSAPVTYPSGDGYYQTPPTATIVQTLPSGRTRAITRNLYDDCLFGGYAGSYLPGQTLYSPFAGYVGCAPYLYSRYAVQSSPWPYIGGQDTSVVISPWAAGDTYITANPARGLALQSALSDISRFWVRGNSASLRRRVLPNRSIAVFRNGQFAYSLHHPDFLALASDALDRVNTDSFRFTDIRERSDGLISATAIHTYRPLSGQDQRLRTARVRCTFIYLNGDWYLSAFSLAPETGGSW